MQGQNLHTMHYYLLIGTVSICGLTLDQEGEVNCFENIGRTFVVGEK